MRGVTFWTYSRNPLFSESTLSSLAETAAGMGVFAGR